jgi:hypothetical protein
MLPPKRHIARRRMELNAKRMSTAFVIVSAFLGAMCAPFAFDGARAAEPTAPDVPQTPPASAAPMARRDVDALLRQSRAAIQQGNLDQAEELLRRAENARLHYPLFHFGATPASVRRELTQAQRKLGPATKPSAQSKSLNRFLGGATFSARNKEALATRDPFDGRAMPQPAAQNMPEAPLPVATRNMPLPMAPVTRPLPPTTDADANIDPTILSKAGAENMPALGRTVTNPFAPPIRDNANKTPDESHGAGNYPVQTAWAAETTGGAEAEAGLALEHPPASRAADENVPWRLPDAPLPPGAAPTESANASPYSLAAPRVGRMSAIKQPEIDGRSGPAGPK